MIGTQTTPTPKTHTEVQCNIPSTYTHNYTAVDYTFLMPSQILNSSDNIEIKNTHNKPVEAKRPAPSTVPNKINMNMMDLYSMLTLPSEVKFC